MFEVIMIDKSNNLHGAVDHIYDSYEEAAYVAANLNNKKELDTSKIWWVVREA